jgi:hypothetical protein
MRHIFLIFVLIFVFFFLMIFFRIAVTLRFVCKCYRLHYTAGGEASLGFDAEVVAEASSGFFRTHVLDWIKLTMWALPPPRPRPPRPKRPLPP